METIEKAEPFFIFCVRSNAEKVSVNLEYHPKCKCSPTHVLFITWLFLRLQKELHFDEELVLKQLQYTGILQMVHIQKAGYSAKYTFKVGHHFLMMLYIIFKQFLMTRNSLLYLSVTRKLSCTSDTVLFLLTGIWREVQDVAS